MKHVRKGKKLKRCVAECWDSVERIRTDAIFFRLNDADDDHKKFDAILNFVRDIEKNCTEIRSCVRDCKHNGGNAV